MGIVSGSGDRRVRLRDVATVTSGYKDREAITRVNGRESVELAVYKEGDANTVQLADGIRTRIEELAKALPPGSEMKLVYDQSRFISSAIGEVREAALIGGLLAILVLYLFLRDARAILVDGTRRLATEVRASLEFHQTQAAAGAEISRALLTGVAASVPGFADALSLAA